MISNLSVQGVFSLERNIDSFMVEFAEEHQVSERILKQIYDVMNRYRNKQKSGEKITGADFKTDMNLASYLNDNQINSLINGMKNQNNWQPIADELANKLD